MVADDLDFCIFPDGPSRCFSFLLNEVMSVAPLRSNYSMEAMCVKVLDIYGMDGNCPSIIYTTFLPQINTRSENVWISLFRARRTFEKTKIVDALAEAPHAE